MILGLGTDIANIERFEKAIGKWNEHLLEKIFTEGEQCEIKAYNGERRRQASKAAKMFAAKEAAVKALGTGFDLGISFHEIELGHDERGKPLLSFSGKAEERILELTGGKNYHTHISLSDDYPFAQAVVIIETL